MTDVAAAPEEAETAPSGPPLVLLALAGVCVAAGAGLLLVGTFAANVAGYLVASLLTIVLVGVYRRVDLIRRLSPGYRPAPAARRVVPVLLVAAFVVAGVHVWAIATEVAS
ncbi:hypothetical protein PO878_15905 [Iamia majanohamensis]|uniref:Uncharacterized protein n=1 Tax=Iamia majanohamensis TaxID=467976 RepID=A0AAE9Y4H9_9ACTN|nr:hypothetical protein [Iamia majanohamensis]WCO65985.1 hypothetical protein PO878_15905 [Iamia majanohamensis]